MTDDEKSPIEQAVDQAMDAFVYAPIGLVFDGPALFPKLVEAGRNQVKVARMMGKMAVEMGQSEATKRMAQVPGPLREALIAAGVVNAPVAEAPPTPPTVDDSTVAQPPKTSPPRPAPAPGPHVDTLAIPDYDSLSASQVVKRLRGMPGADLDAVKAYEAASRARKTILNRITQLQKG